MTAAIATTMQRISAIRATIGWTMNTRAAPLASPMGSMVPCMAASASVVGFPSLSSAQPSGIASPCLAATMTLPRATLLRLRSITRGDSERRGAAKAIGTDPPSCWESRSRQHRGG